MSDERLLAPNRDDIGRFFRLLAHGPHGLTELRIIPPGKKPWIGYFDAEEAFVEACVTWNGQANVYAGRNPRPRVFAGRFPQAHNRLARGVRGAGSADIEVITAFSLDIDPVRERNLSSTEAEHQLALAAANRVASDYPNSIVIDSGNGSQVLFPIAPLFVNGDSRRVEARAKAWEADVRAIVEEDARLKLDSIHDLARIIKVPGTLAIKGNSTPERPHRLARFISEVPTGPCDLSGVFARPIALSHLESPKGGNGIPARFHELLEKDDELRRVWEGKRDDFRSRSEYDLSIADRCARHGFTEQETVRIVMAIPGDGGTHDARRVRATVRKVFQEEGTRPEEIARADPEGLIAQVDRIRTLPETPAWKRHRAVADFVVASLKGRGFFVRDSHDETRSWYFENDRKRLVPVGGPRFLALVHTLYGISEGDKPLFGYVMAAIRTECIERAIDAEVYRLAHYDRKKRLLYVSRFDGQVYRLDGERVDLVPNGTDGVLFADDPSWEPWVYQDEVAGDPLFTHILDRIHFGSGEDVRLAAAEQRTLAGIWVRLLFLPELLPTKPIVLFLGEAGSGKTTALRLILKALFGPAADVETVHRNKEDAFVASISGSHLVAFDNVDGRIDWLNDRLATCATGGQITLRKLYTTNETETFRPRCFLALTARTPRFRREDVADRLLLFRVERLQSFRPERELIEGVAAHRNEVLTGLVNDLNEIVRALRRGEPDSQVGFRMADFGTMAVFLARTAEGDLGADTLRAILARMEEEQGEYAIEDEPLYHALELWLERDGNPRREVTTRELFEDLSRTAKDHGLFWPYRNAVSFGVRLASVWTPLTRRISGRRETPHGRIRVYRFGDGPPTAQMELGE